MTHARITRRALVGAGLAYAACPGARAADAPVLSAADTQAFRAWFSAIVEETVARGPSPRWVHRDCAGLVRFAAREAFVAHDDRWRRAMGWPASRPRPPDVALPAEQSRSYTRWALPGGERADFAAALALIQGNTRLIGRDAAPIAAGDLLFFDQGSDQHLMVWTGRRVAYHTGAEPSADDSGLRVTTLSALLRHPDTRWRASAHNPNFAGWFRFGFLAS